MQTSFSHAHSALYILKSQGHLEDYIATLGITTDDFNLVTGDVVWRVSQKPKVKEVLKKMVFGMAEVVGDTTEAFTAEWVSMMIVTLVQPFNWYFACQFFSDLSTVDNVVSALDSGLTNVDKTINKRMLMALCQKHIMNIDHKVFDDFQKRALAKIAGTSGKASK